MSFGPKMRLKVGDIDIELAPIAKEDLSAFVDGGIQERTVTRYLQLEVAPVLEDEHDWFEKTRTDRDALVWGVYDTTNDQRVLIGTTGVTSIQRRPVYQATSGVLIFRRDYWGKGIASSIHKARTWYLFTQVGLERIKSAYLASNLGSWKALEKSGYSYVYTERNFKFVDGKLEHEICIECLNPSPDAWRRWWGMDRPTKRALAARKQTLAALEWAEQNVQLL